MKKKDAIDIELVVATTGEIFLIEDVPLSITGKELLTEFLNSRNINPILGLAWHLVLGSQIIDESKKISELIDNEDKIRLQLLAKVVGA